MSTFLYATDPEQTGQTMVRGTRVWYRRRLIISLILVALVSVFFVVTRGATYAASADDTFSIEKEPGVGVPMLIGETEFIVRSARVLEGGVGHSLRYVISPDGGRVSASVSVFNPKKDHSVLSLGTSFVRLLPSVDPLPSPEDVTIIDGDGRRYHAHETPSTLAWLYYEIETDAIVQKYDLHYRGEYLFSFTPDGPETLQHETVIGAERVTDAPDCVAPGPAVQAQTSGFQRTSDADKALEIGLYAVSGDGEYLDCRSIPAGKVHYTPDGALVLTYWPSTGWPAVFLYETDGTIYQLISEGMRPATAIDPTGRWVLFSSQLSDDAGTELHVFDRVTRQNRLIHHGQNFQYTLTNDGLLIIEQPQDEGDDLLLVGAPDGTTLQAVKLPEGVPSNAYRSGHGKMLFTYEIEDARRALRASDISGNDSVLLARSAGIRLYHVASPNAEAVLVGVGQVPIPVDDKFSLMDDDEDKPVNGDTVELHRLVDGKMWTVATGVDNAFFDFSNDSRWASVVTRVGDAQNLHVIDVESGDDYQIDNVVVAQFSADSRSLAYTRIEDEAYWTYRLALEDASETLLGSGRVTGRIPESRPLSLPVLPTSLPTATTTRAPTATPSPTHTVAPTVTPSPTSTSVPTRTPRPTRTQEPTSTPGITSTPETQAVTVIAAALNLRDGPGLGYPIVDTLSRHTGAALLAKNADCSWLNVRVANGDDTGLTGWISAGASYVDFDRTRCSKLPTGAFRPATGTLLVSQEPGYGELTVDNGTDHDGRVMLGQSLNAIVTSVYVRAGDKVTVGGVPDGQYVIYYQLGSAWTGETFLFQEEEGRFVEEAEFTTIYEGDTVTYSFLRLTLHPIVGGRGRTVPLDIP